MNRVFLILLWLVILSSSCVSTGSNSNGNVIIQLASDGFKPWDPLSSAANSEAFAAAVHKPPFYFTRAYQLKPGYVKEWAWDAKRNAYTLIVDRGVKFHSGEAISAFDLEFALLKPFLTSLDREEKSSFLVIKGISKLRAGNKFTSGQVEGIRVIDESRIEIVLNRPDPAFLGTLSELLPPLGPISSFKDDLFSPKTVPVGCGNYRVEFSDPKSSLVRVQRFGEVPAGVPLVMDFYSHGSALENKADLAISAGVGSLTANPDYKTYIGDVTHSIQMIEFNFKNRFARQLQYRKVLEMAIDKDAVNVGYKFSTVADQLVPTSFYGRADQKISYDPEAAKKLLKELPAEFSSIRHRFFYHGAKNKLPKYLVRVKEQLERIGLAIDFEQSDQERIEDKDMDIEGYVCGRIVSFANPLHAFSFYLSDGVSPNPDDHYTKLYQQAFTTTDIDSRAAAIKKLNEYSRSQVIQIPLSEDRQVFAYGRRIASIGEKSLIGTFDYDRVEIAGAEVDPASRFSK